jgi:predicted cytidylate kinase
MGKFKNIVICGDVGTGTSTLSNGLAKKLGWQRISGGDFFRKWSRENYIPLWNKMAIPDNIEKKFDQEIFARMKKESNIIFDTHYGGWFARDMPDVFKILLVCAKDITTERILKREGSQREPKEEIEERRKQIRKKFKKLYSQDNYEDPKFFQLVIDTGKTSIEDTIKKAYEEFSKKN